MEPRKYKFCLRCREHHWLPGCNREEFLLWSHDYGEESGDAVTIFAVDHDSAIDKWAEEYDQDDHLISNGEATPTVMICSAIPGSKVYAYEVTGEIVAQYSASLIREED